MHEVTDEATPKLHVKVCKQSASRIVIKYCILNVTVFNISFHSNKYNKYTCVYLLCAFILLRLLLLFSRHLSIETKVYGASRECGLTGRGCW